MSDSSLLHCLHKKTEVRANLFSTSVHQQPAASCSHQQPASPSVISPWQMLNVGSCAKLQQSVDSNEKSLLKGKRDRGRVLHSKQERFLSERQKFMITLTEKPGDLFKVNVWLREDSLKLKSKWTGQVGREEILIWFYTKLIVNLNHSKRSYIIQTNGPVKLKSKTEEYLRAALECPTFPVTPRELRVPEVCLAAFFGLPHHTRNSMGTSGNVFENLLAQERVSPSSPGVAVRLGEGVSLEPQSSTIPTPRFTGNLDAWNYTRRSGRNLFSKLYEGSCEDCFLGIAFRKTSRPR